MKAVLQRVSEASVTVDGSVVSSVGPGYLILLGVQSGDTEADAEKLLKKVPHLRVFEDAQGKMNLSLLDTGGSALVVSQFTLLADCRHGRRPGFTDSAPPAEAERLYMYFADGLKAAGVCDVQTGVFGADMKVRLLNDGPVTILLDSRELK